MSEILISVIIPTRNRQYYAANCIKNILSINQDCIQLVVCDNSDDNSLQNLISDYLNDNRMVYRYYPERISCVENYNRAASLASGKFFLAIGDDDTVLPNVIDYCFWMEKNSIDAIKYSSEINYWWPQKTSIIDKKRHGCVWCDNVSGSIRQIDTFSGVISLLSQGCQRYQKTDLAKSYHGIVRMDRMKEVKEKTGVYYGGCSPDIFSSVSLSLLEKMVCFEVGVPFSLPGVCAQSTSSDSEKGLHAGNLKDAPQFIGMKNYDWDNRIPAYYTVQTIWAETALKAITLSGRNDLIDSYFNLNSLYQEMIANNSPHVSSIMKFLPNDWVYSSPAQQKETKVTKILKRLSRVLSGKMFVSVHCPTIAVAASKIGLYLSKKKIISYFNSIMSFDLFATGNKK